MNYTLPNELAMLPPENPSKKLQPLHLDLPSSATAFKREITRKLSQNPGISITHQQMATSKQSLSRLNSSSPNLASVLNFRNALQPSLHTSTTLMHMTTPILTRSSDVSQRCSYTVPAQSMSQTGRSPKYASDLDGRNDSAGEAGATAALNTERPLGQRRNTWEGTRPPPLKGSPRS